MIGALLGFLLTVALSAFVAAAPDPSAYTRTAGAGGVTVKVVYAPPEYFQAAKDLEGARRWRPAEQVVFLVTLDTHAGDLMAFDLARNIRLRVRGPAARQMSTRQGSGKPRAMAATTARVR